MSTFSTINRHTHDTFANGPQPAGAVNLLYGYAGSESERNQNSEAHGHSGNITQRTKSLGSSLENSGSARLQAASG